MNEILTDELLDEMYPKYRFYVGICKACGTQPLFTFEEFVQKQLKFRAFQIEKNRERGFNVR